LITLCGFISKVTDAFRRMTLLNSSSHFNGFWEGSGILR